MRCRIVNSKDILIEKRFDGSYHNADANVYDSVITKHSLHNLSYYCTEIFTSGRNKRTYTTKTYGYPFLSNSDVLALNPFPTCKYSSQKYGYDKSSLLKGGMILTGRVGAIGQTAFVPDFWERYNAMGSDNIIRIVVKPEYKNGLIYAYLASKIGNVSFWKHATGGVQPFITDSMVGQLPIPNFNIQFEDTIDELIQQSAKLREEATSLLEKAQDILYTKAGLDKLTTDDYDFYGLPVKNRKVSTFVRNRKEISTLTINAFNHSERISRLKNKITCPTISLSEALEDNSFFSTGSFPRIEVKEGKGIMLINQSDIFDTIIKGKYISKRGVNTENLVEYGEVMIAGVGTLGENETFCRAIFANEDLGGQLVSGEFIRMKTNSKIPSGYLYAWLSSEYGFRLIRYTQTGTKLCRPIQKLLLEQPVPYLDQSVMQEIDNLVKTAHTKKYEANELEKKAIHMVEDEIEKWNK